MRLNEADILFIPGLGNSGPDHWQTRWQVKIRTALRVEQAEWDRPVCADWMGRIVATAHSATRPVILIAHSCGVAAVLHAAPKLDASRVRGAFLVACTDPASPVAPAAAASFGPLPSAPLPFPSLLIASRNDPFCTYGRAENLALDLGAALVDAGDSGHINMASGHGPWPEGLMQLAAFMRRLKN